MTARPFKLHEALIATVYLPAFKLILNSAVELSDDSGKFLPSVFILLCTGFEPSDCRFVEPD